MEVSGGGIGGGRDKGRRARKRGGCEEGIKRRGCGGSAEGKLETVLA